MSTILTQGEVAVGQIVTIHHWQPREIDRVEGNMLTGVTTTTKMEQDGAWVGEIFVIKAIQQPFIKVVPLKETYYKTLTWDLRRCILMEIDKSFLDEDELKVLEKVGKK